MKSNSRFLQSELAKRQASSSRKPREQPEDIFAVIYVFDEAVITDCGWINRLVYSDLALSAFAKFRHCMWLCNESKRKIRPSIKLCFLTQWNFTSPNLDSCEVVEVLDYVVTRALRVLGFQPLCLKLMRKKHYVFAHIRMRDTTFLVEKNQLFIYVSFNTWHTAMPT